MLVSMILFVCSLYYFFKFMGQAFFHDVGSKVYGDYHSEARGKQRSRAIGTFVKSFFCFIGAGFVDFLFM